MPIDDDKREKLRLKLHALHEEFKSAHFLIVMVERDAQDAGFDVQTMFTSKTLLPLFAQAVLDNMDKDEAPKIEVH